MSGISFSAFAKFHATAAADLHAACFPRGWNSKEIEALMVLPHHFGWVAERAGKLAGFILYRALGEEAEILTLAVEMQSRRQRIGSNLVDAALQHIGQLKIQKIFLEVAVSNQGAFELYKDFGFDKAGIRKNYYTWENGQLEHGLLLQCNL